MGGQVAFVRVRKANLVEAGWVPLPPPPDTRYEEGGIFYLLSLQSFALTLTRALKYTCASACDSSNVTEK